MELMMLHMLPWQPSNRVFELNIEMVLGQDEEGKKKGGKGKKAQKGRMVRYRLRSGGSISMEWMLIFSTLQTHLCVEHPLHPQAESLTPLK